jgi:hypothetical protein
LRIEEGSRCDAKPEGSEGRDSEMCLQREKERMEVEITRWQEWCVCDRERHRERERERERERGERKGARETR